MRLSFVLCLLLSLVPVASADIAVDPDGKSRSNGPIGVEPPRESWLPTALVGLGIGGLVVLCVTIARRDPSKNTK